MRHYVVVFLESSLFPGTWVTDHFVRKEDREDVPMLPDTLTLAELNHKELVSFLNKWQNEEDPSPSWTLEECILGSVAVLTVLTFEAKEKQAKRIAEYRLRGVLSR